MRQGDGLMLVIVISGITIHCKLLFTFIFRGLAALYISTTYQI